MIINQATLNLESLIKSIVEISCTKRLCDQVVFILFLVGNSDTYYTYLLFSFISCLVTIESTDLYFHSNRNSYESMHLSVHFPKDPIKLMSSPRRATRMDGGCSTNNT